MLEHSPLKGSGWQACTTTQASTVWLSDLDKSRECKRQSGLETRASCVSFCWCDRNSSGTQVTATNAKTAAWKSLCERVKNLIHLKTGEVLWNNTLDHLWLTCGGKATLYFMIGMWLPGCFVSFHHSVQGSQAAEIGSSLSDKTSLCLCCHPHSYSTVMIHCSCSSLRLSKS